MKTIYITIFSILWATLSFAQNDVNYQYDNEGRIIHSDDGTKVQQYQYDNLGNRTGYVLHSTQTNTLDLSVDTINLSNTTLEQNQTYSVSCSVHNNGTVLINTAVLKAYLSSGVTATDTEAGSYIVSNLNNGASTTVNFNIHIPNTANLGSQFLVFYIDATEAIPENDETNNKDHIVVSVVAPNLSELNIQNAALSQATLPAGNTLDLTAEILNTGNLSAGNFTVNAYLSLNTTFDANDLNLNALQNISTLNQGSNTNYSQTITISGNTIPGSYYIIIYVDEENNVPETDENNNNVALPVTISTPEDTLQPVASFTADNQVIEIGNTIHFTDTSTNSPTSWLWYFPGGTPSTSTLQNPVVTYDTPGVYDVTLIVSNANGSNTDNENNYIMVENDSTAPTAVCQNLTVALDTTGNTTIMPAMVNNGSSDNIGIVSYTLDRDTFTCNDIGVNTVSFTVYDAAGNSDTCTATITVEDNLAPAFTLTNLPDINAQCEVTSLTPPSVTDNCSGSVTITNNANLPITTQGTTVITWTVADSSGNNTTQTQNIVINDTTAPVPDITNLPDITAECEVTTLTPPTATDNCSSNVTVTNNANLPINTQGTTVVTWTYDDGNGYTSTQTQNVIIDDITAPDAPSNFAIGTVTETSIAVSADAATDNCGSIDHYNFYLDMNIDGAANGNVSGTSVTPSYTYTSLISGTTYELYVTAVDDAGNESNPSTVVVSTTLGVDNPMIQGFNIYPNPTENILHITADENIKHISITNNLGQKIYDKDVNSKLLQISLAYFTKGTYFIKADSAGGSVVRVVFKK